MGSWDIKKIILFLIICLNFQIKLLPMEHCRTPKVTDLDSVNNLLLKGVQKHNNILIKLALSNGADLNFRHEFNQTMLHVAIDSMKPGNREVAIQNIIFLLNQNINILAVDDNNRNAIHYATIKNETGLVQALVEKIKKEEGVDKLSLAFNCLDLTKGRTPLHHAVINRNLELTKLMLLGGADPTMKDFHGKGFSAASHIYNMQDEKDRSSFEAMLRACCS